MSGQLIITVSRQFGSGGHEMARLLASRFDLPLYEANILRQIAQSRGLDAARLERYDETPKSRLFYRTVNGFNNAPEDSVARMQFQYLRERAAAGESFVVVGRCAEEVLKDFSGLVTLFVLADLSFRLERTMKAGDISRQAALSLIRRTDHSRKTYHNQFCKGRWGDAANYDLCLNSARLGIHGSARIVEAYIRARLAMDPPAPEP